jgi:hypothetical protein
MRGWDDGQSMSTIRGRVQCCLRSKIVIGPSAEGVGKCAGANDGLIAPENQHQPLGVTKRPCWSVVGRLFDLLDKEIGLDGGTRTSNKRLRVTRGPTTHVPEKELLYDARDHERSVSKKCFRLHRTGDGDRDVCVHQCGRTHRNARTQPGTKVLSTLLLIARRASPRRAIDALSNTRASGAGHTGRVGARLQDIIGDPDLEYVLRRDAHPGHQHGGGLAIRPLVNRVSKPDRRSARLSGWNRATRRSRMSDPSPDYAPSVEILRRL